MSNVDYAQIIKTALEQEALLRFDHFSHQDAFDLGCFIVRRAQKMGFAMATAIRKLNGSIVFQYLTDGTTLSNENWMRRKFNTVALTEGCSLRAWASSELKKQDLAAQGLDAKDYALCGGGFPIRLKSGELAAVVTVSNLPHLEDHAFLIDALSEYLGVSGIPRI